MTKLKAKVESGEPVMGRGITLQNGGTVTLFMLDDGVFGWELVNSKGDTTRFSLTREAMNAMLSLHCETTWGPWKVAPSTVPVAPEAK